MEPILSTNYLPNINYLSVFKNNQTVILEKHEHFIKQTERNRCSIYSANGVLNLSIPLQKQEQKTIISLKKIAYTENWQAKHWRAIESSYNNSPYFEFYKDEFKIFYEKEFELLWDYNLALLKLLLKCFKLKTTIDFTTEFQNNYYSISDHINKPYYQVFQDKMGFKSNLSTIDLLFNEGPDSVNFL